MSHRRYVRHYITGTIIQFTQKVGFLKAHLNGFYGWTSIWAPEYGELVRRIKQARNGGQ
jgi:hypothetical protein